MRAAILAVGSELLGEDRTESNSLRLAKVLADHGVELAVKVAIGDREEEIAGEIARLVDRHELVMVTGGLGPTADDVTREAVARALGRELAHDADLERALRARYAGLGRRMPEANRKQADLVAGAVALANRHGTAPGQRIEAGSSTLFLFPGVPHELEAMVEAELRPWLLARTGGEVRERITVRTAGVPESEVDELLAPLYERFPRDQITVLGSAGEVRVRLTAGGSAGPRRAFLAALLAAVREALGEAIFAESESATLEGVVGELLRARGATLAVAESCTGGLVAERLTRVAGASAFLLGGTVAYDNRLKSEWLGVPPALLAAEGAVSEAVARAMAEGVRRGSGADFGLALTGVAGPGGGTAAKPVGTVAMALASPGPPPLSESRLVRLPGDRNRVRWHASQLALDLLRRHLETGLTS